jgi:cyclopropane fatty-acyl-phospholipid synthase-like methyltransferase
MKTIDPDILRILSELEIDGNTVRITTQLDRKTYEAVNKVLEACGGKWKRGKGHLFEGDAAELLDTVITTGQYTSKKNELAFFPTPVKLAEEIVAKLDLKPGMMTLEPSAGTGRIVDALLKAKVGVIFCERDAKMREALYERLSKLTQREAPFGAGMVPHDDFLDYLPWNNPMTPGTFEGFDAVAMNPPFKRVGKGDHLNHTRHAFEMLKKDGKLAAVLPRSVEFRQDKRYREFRGWLNQIGIQGHRHRLERLPDDSFKESGTSVATNLLYIEKCGDAS